MYAFVNIHAHSHIPTCKYIVIHRAMIAWTYTAKYVAAIATVFAILIARYNRSNADIAVQVFAILAVVTLLVSFGRNNKLQAR